MKKHLPEEVIQYYRNAWKTNEYHEEIYAEDVAFYAPMKVFKGRNDVVKALKNWFSMFHEILDFSYVVSDDKAVMLSKILLSNSGGENYLLTEYDYFTFNPQGQIKLYRPIFDSGKATHDLLGFDIAQRSSEARKLADQNQ